MDDLSICKRIAEIEGVTVRDTGEDLEWTRCPSSAIEPKYDDYSPLTDDSLCFKLMIKYEMPPMKCHRLYDCYYSSDEDVILGGGGFVSDKNPNRAICLAIIEAHK